MGNSYIFYQANMKNHYVQAETAFLLMSITVLEFQFAQQSL